ncbi:MAG: RNase adapter RapZ [Novosphingobium sp.]
MPDRSDDRSASQGRQPVLLVTGLLGAGKTTALRELEDLGWEVIDNFPIRLLERVIDHAEQEDGAPRPPLALGFDSRTRGFNPHAIMALVTRLAARSELDSTMLFLDCSGRELERRYNETRHRHPLAGDMPVAAGVAAERELLEPLRLRADAVIDTSEFTANELQQVVRERFSPTGSQTMTITISSFGFARGTPPAPDLVFDMRFLDNPHWDPELRPLTGQDAAVGDHIRKDPSFTEAFARIRDLLLLLIPRYQAQGKAYVHIAFGCTGGRHRSVFTAEQIAATLRGAGFALTLLHRNLSSRTVDLLERGAAQ